MSKKQKIEFEELVKLAHLSRIAMTDKELKQLLPQIESVLEYASCLAQACSAKNPADMPKNINVFRADEFVSTDPKTFLAEGPDVQDDYFVVPTIVNRK